LDNNREQSAYSHGKKARKTANIINELATNYMINLDQQTSEKDPIIIVDEIDDLCSSDRGEIAALVLAINVTKIPIICICNDKYKRKIRMLREHCLELDFHQLNECIIMKRLSEICTLEGLEMKITTMKRLVKTANGDLGYIIRHIQGNNGGILDVKKDIENSSFDVAQLLLCSEAVHTSIKIQTQSVLTDIALVPLVIQRRCFLQKPSMSKNSTHQIQILAKAADAFSQGDVLNVYMHSNQN